MASEVEIVNGALTLLGEGRVISIDDPLKQARSAKAMLALSRDALLGGYNWSFAKVRTQLSALISTPSFGFGLEYQIPSDCLRLVYVSDKYVGADLTDYRGSPTEEYTIEGRKILTDISAPLPVIYIKRVIDTTQFHPNFSKLLSAQLAMDLCEDLTQSETKSQKIERAFVRELRLAIRANAIELPPTKLADDEWLLSRL